MQLEPSNREAGKYVDLAAYGIAFDPYEVLGVPRDAEAGVISVAFRRLAKQWHPDRWVGATEAEQREAETRFKQLNLAQGVLADAAIRQRLAAQELETRALRLTMGRAAEEARAGQATRDVGSIGKYRRANMVKNEQDIAMTALGAQGLGWEGEGFESGQLERTRAWLITRADSIWGGTNEVQLNVIAKRTLKIPE